MINNLPEHERALWILKLKGPMPLQPIAGELQVTVEGARFQLLKLAAEGLVVASSVVKGRGRPQQVWSLTDLGQSRFPDTHADLTVRLIEMTREKLGETALQTIIDGHRESAIQKYKSSLASEGSLEEKVKQLARLRFEEGYMAIAEQEGDAFLLIEHHCPICAAAKACQGFCNSELKAFREVLGTGVEIERVAHIIKGDHRCAYRITAK
ncbi:MarR family transcriptional regulator [Chitinophaga caeni]|uniref:MarR family transcriptional regulator n=1 Tax=Chitinophaga caeni TaxID=2029983 RepID=A0A291QV72_9BACT|nr:metalloregulator ArsR/SmtB family transcription factor [Chitinophaga caeni]ATL47744.1 MarR family transcriptional regulator [Chitinophaga caeni]